jgi:hypothetical protein
MSEKKRAEIKSQLARLNRIIALQKAGLSCDEEHEGLRRDMMASLIAASDALIHRLTFGKMNLKP